MRERRWRTTVDEVCHLAGITYPELLRWAALGVLGPRRQERPQGGYGRHWTREETQRAVLVGRMVRAGLALEVAGKVASTHELGSCDVLEYLLSEGVSVTVSRVNLP